ncbi:MAG: nucleotidyltransferase domain-containing protein [Clostridia bacterium]|nr:nucleotidyltransferase domain-containing protein [Clostridia bacterium]
MCYSIEEIRERSVPVARKYGVRRLGLFGSYARGEADDDSDLDFVINKGKMRGLFEYMGFVLELEDLFGCHVDVVTDGIEDRDFLDRIRKDEVVLYEAV